ncbi:UvrABC system protein A [uncultured archaeon]|nr:UvrABC system protein A [uncultured archaeon]
MSSETITIKGAREHNLKNISLQIPRGQLTVFTGLSGSGKSTLAFDTIYAEGQRRYVESLSAYARQFLGIMSKPDVDSIDGLSPAISIEQKAGSKNPRSTVGTTTEIFDYMRLLWARIGTPYCPKCKIPITSQSMDSIIDQIMEAASGAEATIYAPLIRGQKGTFEKLVEEQGRLGFTRMRIDGQAVIIDRYDGQIDKNKKHDVDLLIDRVKTTKAERDRVAEAVQAAAERAEGLIKAEIGGKETLFSQKNACPQCGFSFSEIQPRLFSFNSPFGACPECHGLGVKMYPDPELVVPDKTKSLLEGAIAPWNTRFQSFRLQQLAAVGKQFGFDMTTPFNKLSKKQQDIVLRGSGEEKIDYKFESKSGDSVWTSSGSFEGVLPNLWRGYMETESAARREDLEKYMSEEVCPACHGKRLKEEALSIFIADKSIIDVTSMPISEAYGFFSDLKLKTQESYIAKPVLKEVRNRLDFLINVGLAYLTLDRVSGTLSGGEAQRIRLATQIGANLTGVLYVLDEPSIGLHQRDNGKLLSTLKALRDLGNTLIVVEHDEDTMRAADHVVDIGPGAGVHGGEVVAEGKLPEIMACKRSLTGAYLRGERKIALPAKRRAPKGWLVLRNCRHNNLQNITVRFPLGCFVGITGVSGSGKSSLISETLYPALRMRFGTAKVSVGSHESLEGLEFIDGVIDIDQSPIGRTPRSNPITYIGAFTPIRDLFAKLPSSRARGWQPGRFSFNVPGGRCMNCEGDGLIRIEMNFLPDVYVPCDECKGRRYDRETLSVRYKGKNIADVLDMTVEEALTFFSNIPSIQHKLQTLYDVGLGYVKLGQSATTLSGGEAQRVKLAAELSKRDSGKTVYILDEPTTGLHFHDVAKLLEVLNRLVEKGNTVIVIEHNLDVVKTADHLIDLGPEGGADGGQIVATGTPEEVARNSDSYTGQYLGPQLRRK